MNASTILRSMISIMVLFQLYCYYFESTIEVELGKITAFLLFWFVYDTVCNHYKGKPTLVK